MTEAFHITPGFPAEQRDTVVALFWGAFGGKLSRVMAPESKALAFLKTVADPNHAISAIAADGTLLGVAGFKTAKGAFIGGTLTDLARTYGWPGAVWRAPLLAMLERAPSPDTLTMDGIFVTEAARGQGIGRALLSAIKTQAQNANLPHVRLDVINTNPRARALYLREGFEVTGRETLGPFAALFGFSSYETMIWRA